MGASSDQQEEVWRDVDRVLDLACSKLCPDDAALLRWAVKGDEKPRKQRWAEMAVAGD